jgi:hypothetical protein
MIGTSARDFSCLFVLIFPFERVRELGVCDHKPLEANAGLRTA